MFRNLLCFTNLHHIAKKNKRKSLKNINGIKTYAELEKVIQTAKQSSVLRIFYLRIKNAKEQKLRFALSL